MKVPHPTIGVDPGPGTSKSSSSAIVAIDGSTIVAAAVLRRKRWQTPRPGAEPMTVRAKGGGQRVWWVEPVEDLADRLVAAIRAASDLPTSNGDGWHVAVEDCKGPGGFAHGRRSPVNPAHLIDTGHLVGVVLHVFRARKVPPGRHGKMHRPAYGGTGRAVDYYPSELIGKGRSVTLEGHDDRGAGEDLLSAWDVAHARWRQ